MKTVRYTAARSGGPDAVRVVGYGAVRIAETLEVADGDVDGLLQTGNWELVEVEETPKRKRKAVEETAEETAEEDKE